MRRKAEALLPSLKRGAIDDAALDALAARIAAAGVPPALVRQLAGVQAALDDFDFPLAHAMLAELLADPALENT